MGKPGSKLAVITGGATGIGRSAPERFIEECAFVFIFGPRQEAKEQFRDKVRLAAAA